MPERSAVARWTADRRSQTSRATRAGRQETRRWHRMDPHRRPSIRRRRYRGMRPPTAPGTVRHSTRPRSVRNLSTKRIRASRWSIPSMPTVGSPVDDPTTVADCCVSRRLGSRSRCSRSCRYADLNRRCSGSISVRAKDKTALLDLNAHMMRGGAPGRFFDVKATSRRSRSWGVAATRCVLMTLIGVESTAALRPELPLANVDANGSNG